MSKCRFIDKCAFYNGSIKGTEESGHFLKQLFCQQFPERCNRLKGAGFCDVGDVNNDMTPWGMETRQATGSTPR